MSMRERLDESALVFKRARARAPKRPRAAVHEAPCMDHTLTPWHTPVWCKRREHLLGIHSGVDSLGYLIEWSSSRENGKPVWGSWRAGQDPSLGAGHHHHREDRRDAGPQLMCDDFCLIRGRSSTPGDQGGTWEYEKEARDGENT